MTPLTASQLPKPGTLSATESPRDIKVLVYGQSGTGKTVFGAGFPGPILLLDTDKGVLSVVTTDIVSDTQKAQIHPVQVDDYVGNSKEPVGYETVRMILESVASTGAYSGVVPATVVVDSFTTTSQMCLAKSQYLNGHLGQQPTLPDYGGQRRHLEKIIKLGIGLPCHFLAICHEDWYKDENSGRLWLTPMIVGKLAREIPLYFDEVYHTSVTRDSKGVDSYVMECSASGLNSAKSRLGLAGKQPLAFTTLEAKLNGLNNVSAKEVVTPEPSTVTQSIMRP